MFEVVALSRKEAQVIADTLTLTLNWREPVILYKGEVIEEVKENLWRIDVIRKEV